MAPRSVTGKLPFSINKNIVKSFMFFYLKNVAKNKA